jgi:hypothetical protein
MEEKKEIYSDGVGKVYLSGGMVRVDYVSIRPGSEELASDSENCVRVILHTQGFLESYNAMGQLVEKMFEAGILKKARAPRKSSKKKEE